MKKQERFVPARKILQESYYVSEQSSSAQKRM